MHHITHGMVTRYGSPDTGHPCHPRLTPLDLAPQEHPMPEESSDECSEDTNTHHHLAELLEQFNQFKDQFETLKSTTPQPTTTTELTQLKDKL